MATAKKASGNKVAAKKAPAKKTSAGRSSGRFASTDATALLTADHDEVAKLFKKYERLVKKEAEGGERQTLANTICEKLTLHAKLEEEIFYPAAHEAGVKEDLLDEAEVEHASVKELISQIQSMSPDEPLYDAKVTVLGEYVNHHVEEEEGEMFPKCRKAKMDLEGLGAQIAERKAAMTAEAAPPAATDALGMPMPGAKTARRRAAAA